MVVVVVKGFRLWNWHSDRVMDLYSCTVEAVYTAANRIVVLNAITVALASAGGQYRCRGQML